MRRLMILSAALLAVSPVVGQDIVKLDKTPDFTVLFRLEPVFAIEHGAHVAKRDWIDIA